jgi:hypothetical protein
VVEESLEAVSSRGLRRARSLYSPHLLNGLLRYAHCEGRMEIISTTRRKDSSTGERAYTQHWYFCSNAKNKGPAVCKHATRYRADLLEAAVIGEFRVAMTPNIVERIAAALNDAVERTLSDDTLAPKRLSAEIARLKKERDNLHDFIAYGGARSGDCSSVREKVTAIDQKIATAEAEFAAASNVPVRSPARAHRQWLLAKLERLQELLAKDPAQAKIEIARHLDGNLALRALPSPANERDD